MIDALNWILSSSLGTGHKGSYDGCHHIDRELTNAGWLWLAETGRRCASSEDEHCYNNYSRSTEVSYLGPQWTLFPDRGRGFRFVPVSL